jgi:hypothetical protein
MVPVAVLVVAFVPFLHHLLRPTRRGLWTAGTLFVGGAIALEMVSVWYHSVHGQENMVYVLIATAEEALEMLGATLALYGLLSHIPIDLPDVAWRIRVRKVRA